MPRNVYGFCLDNHHCILTSVLIPSLFLCLVMPPLPVPETILLLPSSSSAQSPLPLVHRVTAVVQVVLSGGGHAHGREARGGDQVGHVVRELKVKRELDDVVISTPGKSIQRQAWGKFEIYGGGPKRGVTRLFLPRDTGHILLYLITSSFPSNEILRALWGKI